jgi:hypothetical protein
MSLLIAATLLVLAQLTLHAVGAPGSISYVLSVGFGITVLVVLERRRATKDPASSATGVTHLSPAADEGYRERSE